MDNLTDIEKKSILGLISCFRSMNVSAQLNDERKAAGSWLVLGAEIQRVHQLLESLSNKNKELKEFISIHLDFPTPIVKSEVKKYTG